MNIENAIAFVTGANGGIGTALVEELIRRGAAKIYLGARSVNKLDSLIAKYPNKVVPIALDVTHIEQVNAAAQMAKDVTLLVNNAGVATDQGFLSASQLDGARLEMEVNYFGPMLVTRAFAPILAQNDGGAILNILSFLANMTIPFAGSYSASKAAALSLTRGIRAELAAQGTLVVGSMPAQVDTELGSNYPDPKATTEEVARESLDAIEAGLEDVYPGVYAKQLLPQLQDAKAVEKSVAFFLPQPA